MEKKRGKKNGTWIVGGYAVRQRGRSLRSPEVAWDTHSLTLLSAKDWILMTRLSRSEKVDDMSAEGAFGGKEREKNAMSLYHMGDKGSDRFPKGGTAIVSECGNFRKDRRVWVQPLGFSCV